MTIRLLSCSAQRPDRRAISQAFEEYAQLDANEAREQVGYLLEGSEIELDIAEGNTSSAYRAFRKHQIDYELVED